MNACMTPHRIFLLVVFAMYCVSSIDWSQEPREKVSRIWSSEPPADTPFIQSREITGLAFTGRYANYGAADTWYPTWAGNGNLYSPWTDGKVNGVEAASWKGPKATTGYVTIRSELRRSRHLVSNLGRERKLVLSLDGWKSERCRGCIVEGPQSYHRLRHDPGRRSVAPVVSRCGRSE